MSKSFGDHDTPSDTVLNSVLDRILASVHQELDDQQVEKVRKGIQTTFKAMETMQQTELANGDEPYFVFHARNSEE